MVEGEKHFAEEGKHLSNSKKENQLKQRKKAKSKKQQEARFREDEGETGKEPAENKKFHFKFGGAKQQYSTVYGTKFMEFRKTFTNFNANSNKAFNV